MDILDFDPTFDRVVVAYHSSLAVHIVEVEDIHQGLAVDDIHCPAIDLVGLDHKLAAVAIAHYLDQLQVDGQ